MLHDWVVALAGAPWVYLALFGAAALDGVFPPVPSESVVIALAALSASTGSPNLVLIVLVAGAGAFTGDQLAYALGSRLDVRRVRVLRNRRAQRTIDWAETALTRRGTSFILAARYIPIGRVAVNMTAGATAFPHRRFVMLTALAGLTWAVYSAGIGLTAGTTFQDRPVVAIAIGVAGGLLGGFVLDRLLARRRARDEVVDTVGSVPGAAAGTPATRAAARSHQAQRPDVAASPAS